MTARKDLVQGVESKLQSLMDQVKVDLEAACALRFSKDHLNKRPEEASCEKFMVWNYQC